MEAILKSVETGGCLALGETQLIGRKRHCQVCIRDQKVSSDHAMIRRGIGGSFWLIDLRSLNGTWVNGKRVTDSVRLAAGDRIRFGDAVFEFRHERAAPDPGTFTGQSRTAPETVAGEGIFLVSDVREFTRKCEALPVDALVGIMSAWYGEVRKAIEGQGGAVDKFLGDAALAYWSDVGPESHRRALEAARAVSRLGARIASDFSGALAEQSMDFDTGVALHRGEYAHGPVGGVDFTLLGSGVTAAFRLEGITRLEKRRVVASAAFLRGHPDEKSLKKTPLGRQSLRGIAEAIEVFALDWDAECKGHD